MKKSNIFKISLSCLLALSTISTTFAVTTEKWRDIIDQLRDDWRPDWEIKPAIEDLWYNAEEYLWKIKSDIIVIRWNETNYNTSTKIWEKVLQWLKDEWRTDEEIIEALEDLWYDPDIYIKWYWNHSWSYKTTYTSRSCKSYDIEYIASLNVYTSPDLQKREYFTNIEYLKRYIDSKNPQKNNCPTNWWWISKVYEDTSNSSERYIAPNWKVYFISHENWFYTSKDLDTQKKFSTLSELKNFLRNNNPLTWIRNTNI